MENNQNNNQNGQGKDAKKISANYDQIIKKVTAIVSGPENLKLPKKTALKSEDPNDEFDLVGDLFKEEREALRVEVRDGLKKLLKDKIALDAAVEAERKKLEAFIIAKKKEFNAAATVVLNKVDGMDAILAGYKGAFEEAATAASENEEADDTTVEETE